MCGWPVKVSVVTAKVGMVRPKFTVHIKKKFVCDPAVCWVQGIVVGAWPYGTILLIGELFGAESLS